MYKIALRLPIAVSEKGIGGREEGNNQKRIPLCDPVNFV